MQSKSNSESPVTRMLDNAACAAQCEELLDNKILRGAVLRSINQWLALTHYTVEDALKELQMHEDYNK